MADLGRKLQAAKAELDDAKKKAARKAKRAAAKAKKESKSKPIKKAPPKVRTQTEWVGDPLDDPLPF